MIKVMMYLKVLALPMHMPLWHSMYIVVAGVGVGYINIIHSDDFRD